MSDAHVYLTAPFVLSWSLLNALACGCQVVASDTAPVRELIRNGENGWLVDFFDVSQLAERILQTLDAPSREIRERARETICQGYSLPDCLQQMLTLYEDVAGERREHYD